MPDLEDPDALAGERVDLVMAANVAHDLSDPERFFRRVRERLAPGGVLIFNLERGAEGSGYTLQAGGRYAHAPDLLRDALAKAGLRPLRLVEDVLRQGPDAPVAGLLVSAGGPA